MLTKNHYDIEQIIKISEGFSQYRHNINNIIKSINSDTEQLILALNGIGPEQEVLEKTIVLLEESSEKLKIISERLQLLVDSDTQNNDSSHLIKF